MKFSNPRVIFSFFGPPGSGKGTLAERLKKDLGFQVLSTGNLCRMHVANKSLFGVELEKFLNKGQLIPDDLIIGMVKEWLENAVKAGKPIILDGFPRTAGQALNFLRCLQDFKDFAFRVIFIELPEDQIIKRLSTRLVCESRSCQATFNKEQQVNFTCSCCGGKLIRRADDDITVIQERLRQYPAYRDALLATYAKLGQPVELLNVTDKTVEQVYQEFTSII